MDLKNNYLGVIPAGTGNDFYRTMSLSDELIYKSDIGKINDYYFIHFVSFGLDALINENANLMRKLKIPRKQIYNISLLYTYLLYKNNKYLVVFNDKNTYEGKKTIITIANGKIYGGGFNIAPSAELDSGLLEAYIANDISKLKVLTLVPKLVKGTHESDPSIIKEVITKANITSKDELIVAMDGEVLKGREFDIEIIPKAVNLYNDKSFTNNIIDKAFSKTLRK